MRLHARVMERETAYRLWQAPFAEKKLGPLFQHNDPIAARRVLDVGCGPGTNARHFAHAALRGRDFRRRDRRGRAGHADDPARLLGEAARVTRGPILIKDHTCDRFLAVPTLRLMDRVGNARHGVALPYRYWRRQTWFDNFSALGLEVTSWKYDLGLYPAPAKWFFGGSLHFLASVSSK